MKPFYRYLGGKTRELKNFIDLVPEYTLYVEPFFGGGAVFWHLEPEHAIINDSDQMLMEFLKTVQLFPEVFDDVVHDWPCTKENFLEIRDNWVSQGKLSDIKRYFYFLRTSFNGYLRYNSKKQKYNMSFGNKKVITPIPSENQALLKNASIYSTDFKEIFKTFDKEDAFFFLDPPYDGLFSYLYDGADKSGTRVILEDLKKIMISCKAKCLMTVGATPFTESLFEGMIKRRYSTKHTFGAHCKDKNLSTETLVITNY